MVIEVLLLKDQEKVDCILLIMSSGLFIICLAIFCSLSGVASCGELLSLPAFVIFNMCCMRQDSLTLLISTKIPIAVALVKHTNNPIWRNFAFFNDRCC